MAPAPRTPRRAGRGRGEEAAERKRSKGREETPVVAFSTSLPDRYGLHFLRSLEPQAVERILKNDPGGGDEIDPGIPKTLRFRREHGAVTIELVELSREFRRLRGHGMDPPSKGGVPQARWELRDPTKEALLLRMDQEAVIRPAASVRLGEDAAGPRMGVLDERR